MAQILLAALNASFSHTNIAVRSIALYCQNNLNKDKQKDDSFICFDEWTINQQTLEILRGILNYKPKIVLFSTYIWNIEIIEKLVRNLKSFDDNIVIGMGGPEVSFNAPQVFERLDQLDFICSGEGEETVFEIASLFNSSHDFSDNFDKHLFLHELHNIKGLYLKSQEKEKNQNKVNVIFTGSRELIKDLSCLYFPYPVIAEPDSKIYYYESSRGCPFSCAYCMSSLDKRVRFMPLERVFKDLQFFFG